MLKQGKLFLLASFLLILCQLKGISQPTGTIRLESGGSVPFHINSLQKYNEGMVLNNWTRFSILIENLDPADTWRLEVLASDPKMAGDYGRDLELDYISITAEASNLEAENLNYFPINQLTDGPQTLATGQGPGLFVIWISYSIGTDPDNTLLGEHPDYYFVQIYFDIKSD
jgi:hypothetical protein